MNAKDRLKDLTPIEQMNEAARKKLYQYAGFRKIKKGEYLFHAREHVACMYIVVDGYAVLERINKNHERKAIFIFDKGKMLNEVMLQDPVSSVGCYALTDLEVLYLPTGQFLEIMALDFKFTRKVIDSMAMKIRRLYHQIENTTKSTKLERQVASRLWKMGRDFGVEQEDGIRIEFDVSITFLAELVGSNRETVSRIIKKFAEDGIVSIKQGVCRIYQMDRLKEIRSDSKNL